MKILENKSVWFDGMQDCTLGVWAAHGEGRYGNTLSKLTQSSSSPQPSSQKYFPIRYVNESNTQDYTMEYPYNPNGSAFGIAGATSENGLHLAMMPHPERSLKSWQTPWYPESWQSNIDATHDGMCMPWTRMFKNVYDFSKKQKTQNSQNL